MSKLYNVEVLAKFQMTYEVEADSEDEANEKAMQMFSESYSDDWDSLEATAEGVIED